MYLAKRGLNLHQILQSTCPLYYIQYCAYYEHFNIVEWCDKLILDGRISEDSAVDLGDIITDEEEIIEELIKRGTLKNSCNFWLDE